MPDFVEQPTESALTAWRNGNVMAERLVASMLHAEGYEAVDPQSPLGGPDGLKDVVFVWNDWKYIAAAYFPATSKTPAAIKTKFTDDLEGVGKNKASGIAFFTGQRLTPSQKAELKSEAEAKGHKAIIFDAEAIRSVLDSPRGYGMRLEFLRIPMKPEEQLSFVSQFGLGIESKLDANSDLLRDIGAKIDALADRIGAGDTLTPGHAEALMRTMATRAVLDNLAEASDKESLVPPAAFVTKGIDVDQLRYLHRVLLDGHTNDEFLGMLRAVQVWIGPPGSTAASAVFVPPEPDKVPELLEELLDEWRDGYGRLETADLAEKLQAVVQFHADLLNIHPFQDGNGRVARVLLEQQARELLGVTRRIVIQDSLAYAAALRAADSGDLTLLKSFITQVLFGVRDLADVGSERSGSRS